MHVAPCPPEILRIGQPAPVSVRDATGHLLWAKGVVLASEAQRQSLVSRELYVDARDGDLIRRALNGKIETLLRQGSALGQIAEAQADGEDIAAVGPVRRAGDPLPVTMADLQMHVGTLLQDPPRLDYAPRLQAVADAVRALVDTDADRVLLLLVHGLATEAHHHTALRALLVAVVGDLASRRREDHTPEMQHALRCAALSLHLRQASMLDQLALQAGATSPQQQAHLDERAAGPGERLRSVGVDDAWWLQAVEPLGDEAAGPLAGQPPAMQIARLLRRADAFAERLSLRRQHKPVHAAAAMKSACLDAQQQADPAGLALIQATGIYLPGSFVQLKSGELAMVLKRGSHPSAPKVVSLVGRQGTPLAEPAVRDTRLRAHEVGGGIVPQEVRVRPNLERLLKLV